MNAPLATEILEPESIEEAISVLKEKGADAAVIAGGTDLIIKLKETVVQPTTLVDIMKLSLNYIKGSRLRGFQIGSTTSAKEICASALLKRELPVLVDAAIHLGGPQTQELATIGGNLCNASPCANFTNALVALDASLKITGVDGEREMLVVDFCRGPGVVDLKPTELVSEIVIPAIQETYGASYVKHTLRREMDIAIVGVVVFIIPEGNKVKKIRIALGSVGSTVLLAQKAQGILEGKAYSNHRVETAANIAAEKDASYIDDVRSSAAYRKKITASAVQKGLKQAWKIAKGGRR